MTKKQIVEDSLERIQDQDLEFVLAVRQGLAELDRGEQIPIEEVERDLSSWVIK